MSETIIKNTEQVNDSKTYREPNKALWSISAVLLAITVGLMILAFSGAATISQYLGTLFNSSFGSLKSFGNFLGNLAWVIPIGLAMVASFKVGVFNIGSAGQMLFSGFVGYAVAIGIGGTLGFFGPILIGLCAMLTGVSISMLIGYLKIKFKINEVISSIMFNWILFYIVVSVYTENAWDAKTIDLSLMLTPKWLTSIFDGSQKINLGIIISPLVLILMWFLYKKTRFGLKQDIIGNNPSVAENIGISKDAEYMKALTLSGLLAGIAGWIFIFGAAHQKFLPTPSMEISGAFFQGITVALLGFSSITGVIFSSILIAFFSTAEVTSGSLPITDIILALMVVFLSITHFFIFYKPISEIFNSYGSGDSNEETDEETKKIKKEKKC